MINCDTIDSEWADIYIYVKITSHGNPFAYSHYVLFLLFISILNFFIRGGGGGGGGGVCLGSCKIHAQRMLIMCLNTFSAMTCIKGGNKKKNCHGNDFFEMKTEGLQTTKQQKDDM